MRRTLLLLLPLLLLAAYACDEQLPAEPEAQATGTSAAAPSQAMVPANTTVSVIDACYDNGGSMYAINQPGLKPECKKNHGQLTWNVQGPPGPSGPQGPQGDPGPAGAVTVLTVSEQMDLTPLWGGEKLLSCPTGYTSTSGGWLLVSPGSSDWASLYQAGSFKVLDSWKWKFKNWSTTVTFRVLLEVYCLPKAS